MSKVEEILAAFNEGVLKGMALAEKERQEEIAFMARQLDAMSAMLGDQFEIGRLLMEYDRTTKYSVTVQVSDCLMRRQDYRELLQSISNSLFNGLLQALLDKEGGIAGPSRANRQPLFPVKWD